MLFISKSDSDKKMSDNEDSDDYIVEEEDEEDEEGQIDSDEAMEEEGNECDPQGLFDALAAAKEAGENLINHEKSKVDKSCRLQQDYLVTAFLTATRLRWPLDEKKDSASNDIIHWSVGERVMAIYYEDRISYRAKILQLKDWKSAAVVRFSDYGNEEEVNLSDLTKIDKIKKPSKVFQ